MREQAASSRHTITAGIDRPPSDRTLSRLITLRILAS